MMRWLGKRATLPKCPSYKGRDINSASASRSQNRGRGTSSLYSQSFGISSLCSRSSGKGLLAPFLQEHGVVRLDGGFCTTREEQPQHDALSDARLLFTSGGHQTIQEVHTSFLRAGADVISTNSYQVSYELFQAADVFNQLPGGAIKQEKHQLRYTKDVLRTAVELARKSRHEYLHKLVAEGGQSRLKPLVAASVGPAGDNEVLCTGATDPESARHHLTAEVITQYYSRKIASLAMAKPDLVLLETLPGVREARLALAALQSSAPHLPALVLFACWSEKSTAGGDDFAQTVAEMAEHPSVTAVGLNCTAPEHVEGLLTTARACSPDAILAACPSSGGAWDSTQAKRCWHSSEMPPKFVGSDEATMRGWGADVICISN